jgi:hypothetical protein
MARSIKALKKNTLRIVEKTSTYAKKTLYYGFIPALLYLGFTTDPKPNVQELINFIKG